MICNLLIFPLCECEWKKTGDGKFGGRKQKKMSFKYILMLLISDARLFCILLIFKMKIALCFLPGRPISDLLLPY